MSGNSEGWVEPSKRTTAWYLFNKHFFCRVGNMQSMSTEYLRYHGMPTSGVKAYDDAMANELVPRALTINDMVEMHKRGVNVELEDPTSAKTIYEFIEAHLVAWKNQLMHMLGTPDEEVVKDLIYLDNFANVVYAHAKYHFSPDTIDSVFARKIGGVLSISNGMLLAPRAKEVVLDAQGAPEPVDNKKYYPERTSLRQHFLGAVPAAPSGPGPRKWN